LLYNQLFYVLAFETKLPSGCILYFSVIDNIVTGKQIRGGIVITKAAFSKKKALFTSKSDLNLRKKLVKCYIWSIALYGAETGTLQAGDQKYLESYEM